MKTGTVLFQVPNRIGLGHINRMSCVASALLDVVPQARVLFVVDGASHGMLEAQKLPYLTMPHPDSMFREADWSAWSQSQKWKLSGSIVGSILDSVKPDLVVYDCFPSLHFVGPVIRRGIRTVLCVRKMKDFGAYSGDLRLRAVLREEPDVIIPHDAGEFFIPPFLARKAVFVGAIVKKLPLNPVSLQKRFTLVAERVIVITAGGGGYPGTVNYFNLCISAFRILRARRSGLVALLVTGPLFADWVSLNLASDVRVVPFDTDFASTCGSADLVLSQAGYNSINELLALSVPAICVPAERGSDDQFERARGLPEKSSNIGCFEGDSAVELATLMESRLDGPRIQVRTPIPDGAYRAAEHLIKLLGMADGNA